MSKIINYVQSENSLKLFSSLIGIYAGILGLVHGISETLQGNTIPSGIIFNAIGSACQSDQVWHSCLPAMTFIPNLLLTGIFTSILSILVLFWAFFFIEKKNGGYILMLFSIVLLIVGGGFFPPFFGIIAGVIGSKIEKPLTWWDDKLSPTITSFLSKLWPIMIFLFFGWVISQWIFGLIINEVMLKLGSISFLLEFGLLFLSILASIANYLNRQISNESKES